MNNDQNTKIEHVDELSYLDSLVKSNGRNRLEEEELKDKIKNKQTGEHLVINGSSDFRSHN